MGSHFEKSFQRGRENKGREAKHLKGGYFYRGGLKNAYRKRGEQARSEGRRWVAQAKLK